MTDEYRNTVSKDGSREWQGCDPYNGQVTGDVSGTITCFVGSSTSKGPKIIDSKTFVKCGHQPKESCRKSAVSACGEFSTSAPRSTPRRKQPL